MRDLHKAGVTIIATFDPPVHPLRRRPA